MNRKFRFVLGKRTTDLWHTATWLEKFPGGAKRTEQTANLFRCTSRSLTGTLGTILNGKDGKKEKKAVIHKGEKGTWRS